MASDPARDRLRRAVLGGIAPDEPTVDNLVDGIVDAILARSTMDGDGWLIHDGKVRDILEIAYDGEDDGAESWTLYTHTKEDD